MHPRLRVCRVTGVDKPFRLEVSQDNLTWLLLEDFLDAESAIAQAKVMESRLCKVQPLLNRTHILWKTKIAGEY